MADRGQKQQPGGKEQGPPSPGWRVFPGPQEDRHGDGESETEKIAQLDELQRRSQLHRPNHNKRSGGIDAPVTIEVMETDRPVSRVLVVDDEESQRTALASMIRLWGYAVETASDGQEALEKLA